jgi:hypothetical protein
MVSCVRIKNYEFGLLNGSSGLSTFQTDTVVNGEIFGGVVGPYDDYLGLLFGADEIMSTDVFWSGGGFPKCYESLSPPLKNIDTASKLVKPTLKQLNFRLN